MERIECFSGKRLARRWSISHRTLERWRHKGTGPAFLRIGGRIMYRLEDIEAFEKDRVRQSGPAAAPDETAR
jgi:predicted site-specific integrase-resolvase